MYSGRRESFLYSASAISRALCAVSDANAERHPGEDPGGNGDSVSPDELAAAIEDRVLASDHRPAFEIQANIFRELLHGRITSFRRLAQRHHQDIVNITP